MAILATGSVKWFNDAKGYGFIGGAGEEDIFVHFSAIITDGEDAGWRTLNQGDVVEYEVTRNEKGLRAENVRVTRAVPISSREW